MTTNTHSCLPILAVNLMNLRRGEMGGMEAAACGLVRSIASAWPEERRILVCSPANLADVRRRFPDWRTWKVPDLPELPPPEYDRALRDLLRDAPADEWIYPLPHHSSLLIGAPFHLVIHDLLFERLPALWPHAELEKRRRLEYAQAAAASTVLAFSGAVCDDLLSLWGIKGRRIPFPFDAGAIRRTALEGAPALLGRYLIYPAGPWPHKNHSRLVAAWQGLGDRRDTRLLLTGVRPGGLRGLIDLPADGSVVEAGCLSETDYLATLAAATGMIYPSLGEGYGIPPREACALGVPFASSRLVPSLQDCRNECFTFDPYSVDSIRDALARLVECSVPTAGQTRPSGPPDKPAPFSPACLSRERKTAPARPEPEPGSARTNNAHGRSVDIVVVSCGRIAQLGRLLASLRDRENGMFVHCVTIVLQPPGDIGAVRALASASDCRAPVRIIAKTINTDWVDAVNTGVSAASAPYVLFLNEDMACSPGSVALSLERHGLIFGTKHGLVTFSDGLQGGRIACSGIFDRGMPNLLGGTILHGGYRHFYADVELTVRSTALDAHHFARDISIMHLHEGTQRPQPGTRRWDTYLGDERLFLERRERCFDDDTMRAILKPLPDDEVYWHYSGLHAHRTNRPGDARACFERVLALCTTDPAWYHAAAHAHLAMIAEEQGDDAASRRHAVACLELNPGDMRMVRILSAVNPIRHSLEPRNSDVPTVEVHP